jgi:hypothetical protein
VVLFNLPQRKELKVMSELKDDDLPAVLRKTPDEVKALFGYHQTLVDGAKPNPGIFEALIFALIQRSLADGVEATISEAFKVIERRR